MNLIRSLLLVVALGTSATTSAAQRCPSCLYDVKINSVYDGDTFYFNWPGLPRELNPLAIRLRGVDTPEMKGKCPREKALAQRAKAFTVSQLNLSAGYVRIGDIKWDKYGGRIDADVYVGSQRASLAPLLIRQGLARPYEGGKKLAWC